MAPTIRGALQHASQHLRNASPSAHLDAELMLSTIIDKPRSHLHAWPEQSLSADQDRQLQAWVEARQHGTPIAYLLGYRDFWKHRFEVTPDVLVPRPDTEVLVETALASATSIQQPTIADLGTGSGAIAISLALDCPTAQVTATDQSAAALSVAQRNAKHLGATNITFLQSDWFQALTGVRFDVIVSNPPYIDPCDPHLNQDDLRHEPTQALVSEDHGLRDLTTIIKHAPAQLSPNGWLMLEHGYDQADAVAQLLERNHYQNIQHRHDLNQHIRVTLGQRPIHPN